MKPMLVVYATREGHTRQVASFIEATLLARGWEAALYDASSPPRDIGSYAGVILAASVHGGRHEKEMVRFVRDHLSELGRMPAAFVSVSMSEATYEDSNASLGARAAAASSVRAALQTFYRQTGWQPRWLKPVAGALLYTRYGTFTKLIVRFMAKRGGASTDTSCDHEYTDWRELEDFIEEFADAVAQRPAAAASQADTHVEAKLAS